MIKDKICSEIFKYLYYQLFDLKEESTSYNLFKVDIIEKIMPLYNIDFTNHVILNQEKDLFKLNIRESMDDIFIFDNISAELKEIIDISKNKNYVELFKKNVDDKRLQIYEEFSNNCNFAEFKITNSMNIYKTYIIKRKIKKIINNINNDLDFLNNSCAYDLSSQNITFQEILNEMNINSNGELDIDYFINLTDLEIENKFMIKSIISVYDEMDVEFNQEVSIIVDELKNTGI